MKDGGTLRDHLKSVERQTRQRPPELNVPDPPHDLHTVLPAFLHLSGRRPFEQGQPLPIQDTEIEAYARLRRIPLTPHDVDLITTLDGAWLKAMRKDPTPEAPTE